MNSKLLMSLIKSMIFSIPIFAEIIGVIGFWRDSLHVKMVDLTGFEKNGYLFFQNIIIVIFVSMYLIKFLNKKNLKNKKRLIYSYLIPFFLVWVSTNISIILSFTFGVGSFEFFIFLLVATFVLLFRFINKANSLS